MKGAKTIKTFLIIDDDRVFANAVKDYLSNNSMEVLIANTASEGITLCQQQRIDVVLLDQQLPDGEGHTLCPAILRSNDQTKIIFTTAFPSFENAIKAIRSGASDYLSKPYNLEELSLSVRQAIRTLELENLEQIQNYRSTRESEDTVLIGGGAFGNKETGGTCSHLGFPGAHYRRDRNRKDPHGKGHSLPGPLSQGPLYQHKLCVTARDPHRGRAVRIRKGCLYRLSCSTKGSL